MIYTLEIPGWHPATYNQLHSGRSWGKKHRLKSEDRETIGRAVLAYGVPPATGKRRVRLLLVLAKGQRACDPDAFFKSLLDGLKECGALRSDGPHWVELTTPRYLRVMDESEDKAAFITLEDL